MEDIKYTWLPFFEELFNKICIEHNPKKLYDLWLQYFPEKYKTYTNENPVSIEKMDPLTFVGKILSLGNERLFRICADLKDIYDLSSDVPMDFAGIPRIERNNPTFWDEAWIGTKSPNDAYFNQVINNLWLFAKNLNQIDENNRNIDEGLIKTILAYRNIAIPKLSQIMFIVKPNIFYSCDGKSLLYINYKLKNNQDFNEFLEIQKISNETGKTPYELSLQAELNKPVDVNKNFKKLKWWEITALAMYINNPDAKYTETNIIELDLIKKAMEIKQLASPPSVGTEMRELSNSSTDYKRKNEYFIRYEEDYVKYSLNDNGKKYVETKLKDYIQEFNKGEWFPKDYTPKFSIDDWVNILQNPRIFDNNSLKLIKRMYDIGGQASCKQLAEKYGLSYSAYIGYAAGLGQRIYRETNCPLLTTDNENSKWWVIPFIGRGAYKQEVGTSVWKLRNELQSAIEKVDLSQIELYENGGNKMNIPLNQILYGPPGTGKTYKANQIINVFNKYNQDIFKKNKKISKDLSDLTWSEAIALGMSTDNQGHTPNEIYELKYTKEYLDNKKQSGRKTPECSLRSDLMRNTIKNEQLAESGKTGNDYFVYENGKYKLSDNGKLLAQELLKAENEKFNISDFCKFVTFHQSYSFEDFVIGIKPKEEEDNLLFKKQRGIFKKLCDEALNNPDYKYLLIIDEINRGNISKIFGELITLIEDKKRWGNEEQMYANLPTGDVIKVPSNLYIIGTMNTADKSLALLDAALRRRFEFIPMYPKYIIEDENGNNLVRHSNFLKSLNEEILKKKQSADYMIGHSYFMNDKSLEEILNLSVIPLLMEYFNNKVTEVKILLDKIADIKYNCEYLYDNDKYFYLKVETATERIKEENQKI